MGLGSMGGPIAARLLDGGSPLVLRDTRPEAVARFSTSVACGSPREVADRATIVFVSLPTPQDVLDVVAGADGAASGSVMRVLVDLSTTGPAVAQEIASVLADRGIGYLDAPVSGGPRRATAGELAVMAAGTRSVFDEVAPLLERFASSIFHVGDAPGQGQLVKVINNLLSAAAIAVTGEALVLASKRGLDPGVVLDVVNASSGRNTATADKYPRCVLPRRFDYGFRLNLMAKDVALCLAEADRSDVPMVAGGAIHQLFQIATQVAPGDADVTWIAQLFEQWGDAQIPSCPPDRDTLPAGVR